MNRIILNMTYDCNEITYIKSKPLDDSETIELFIQLDDIFRTYFPHICNGEDIFITIDKEG